MKDLKSALLLFLFLTFLLGGIYPAVVTITANLLFPHQAGGSLITDGSGRVVGSSLIGQPFSEAKYFWPRPSATPDFAYNPLLSAGSNLSPANPELLRQAKERIARLRETGITGEIPADMVFASAGGLDPHISPEAAWLQAPRIAGARGLSVERVHLLVVTMTQGPQAGTLGAPRVNVLALNMALDENKTLP
ncbi:MAG: potassium-transporting ATPase subunit KdpC [Pseudomonadota bacterium]